ncbi:MAG TPA: hypothetical protein VFQ51_10295 [Vicinamibacteria bacterium]|nr:hypothetical protein [Vicinamibacteria bacterium]
MKLGLAVFAVLLALGVGTAEAGRKFPKAIDSPIVRQKVREYHKPGTRVKHLMEGSKISAVLPDAAPTA